MSMLKMERWGLYANRRFSHQPTEPTLGYRYRDRTVCTSKNRKSSMERRVSHVDDV
jgi:hypothetical protein